MNRFGFQTPVLEQIGSDARPEWGAFCSIGHRLPEGQMLDHLLQLGPLVGAAVLTVTTVSSAAMDGEREALRRFQHTVDAYRAVREQLDRHLPPLEVSDDPQRVHEATEARRHAILRARADARPGDIFNEGVAGLIRSRTSDVFAGRPEAVARLLAEMTEHGDQWQRPEVNGRFVWRTAAATPASVLAVLPSLPAGLEYRFVGPDLALVDIDASVILDILSDVLDVPSRTRPR